MIGLLAAFDVAVAYGLIELMIGARSVLIIIGLALFIAAGLDPVVGWLVRHRVPRPAAVLVVIGCAAAIAAGSAMRSSPRPAASGWANFITSIIADLGTYLWLLAFGIPYPLLLGVFVALLDLIPVIGSTVGGAVMTLIALTVSLPAGRTDPEAWLQPPARRLGVGTRVGGADPMTGGPDGYLAMGCDRHRCGGRHRAGRGGGQQAQKLDAS